MGRMGHFVLAAQSVVSNAGVLAAVSQLALPDRAYVGCPPSGLIPLVFDFFGRCDIRLNLSSLLLSSNIQRITGLAKCTTPVEVQSAGRPGARRSLK